MGRFAADVINVLTCMQEFLGCGFRVFFGAFLFVWGLCVCVVGWLWVGFFFPHLKNKNVNKPFGLKVSDHS